MRRSPAAVGALFVIAAGILFGTTGTAQTFAPAEATPLEVGSVRLALGGSLLALIGLTARVRRTGWGLPAASPTAWWILLGGASVMAYQATFFAGTRSNGVAIGTVLALGSSPVFAGLIEWLVLRRAPRTSWLIATALAVTGMVGLTGVLGGTAAAMDPLGMLASLGAGASYAIYTVSTKAVLVRGWSAASAVGAMLGVGAVLAGAVVVATRPTWVAQPSGIAVVAWLGVVTVVLTYTLLGQGLRRLSAATATTLTLAEPATAALLGVILLSESLSLPQVLGMAAVVAGVMIAGLAAAKE